MVKGQKNLHPWSYSAPEMSSILSESYQHLQSIVVQRDIRKFLSISTALCGCLLLKTLILKWTSLRRAFAALGYIKLLIFLQIYERIYDAIATFLDVSLFGSTHSGRLHPYSHHSSHPQTISVTTTPTMAVSTGILAVEGNTKAFNSICEVRQYHRWHRQVLRIDPDILGL